MVTWTHESNLFASLYPSIFIVPIVLDLSSGFAFSRGFGHAGNAATSSLEEVLVGFPMKEVVNL